MVITHRWMGLGSGVLLAAIGLTGTLFLLPGPTWFREMLEELHVHLMIPVIGREVVIVATAVAVLLELGGLYLWWKRGSWSIRWRAGWRLLSYDLHNVIGAGLLVIMLLLAVTGVARVAVRQVWPNSSVIVKGTNVLHTGLRFPAPIQVIYAIGGMGFLVQGVTGVVMWWPVRGRARANGRLRPGG